MLLGMYPPLATYQQGLTEFDFVLADAIDELPVKYSPKFQREQTAHLHKFFGKD